ncbi:hypothetical protein [Umboniibacter marinipuniceus]|uniref:Uncharacterized protein n=1 Tax=Umboniibacter marinipuniceus TaxID=569599 RepID=A0A3M0A904_9GAMM|nr:hypothetical protein [Umboniibacter marinipuniceus]RMA81017.1 hypothetical protein DFR27_0807 [Umboniibacter marinipuniceus]
MGFNTKPDYEGTVTWSPLRSEGGPHGLSRTAVPGGWLVAFNPNPSSAGGLTFMPDPTHSWDGNSLVLDEPTPSED